MLTYAKKTPQPADVAIGSNIRTLRVIRGISQERLGDAIGVTFQQVQKYEKGTNRVGGSRAIQIAAALKVSVSELYKGLEVNADNEAGETSLSLASAQSRQELELLTAFRGCSHAARLAIVAVAEAARQ
jgi:transcriptional regulator with XRE-family HTH domain